MVISLVGCSTPVKRIEISTTPIEKAPLELPEVTPFQLENIEWILVTENNIDTVFAELEKKKYDPVVFGVSDAGYESLSLNLAKIKQLVEQQKAIIIAYQQYYVDQNETIDKSNQEYKDKKKEIENSSKTSTPDWWEVWK